MPTGIPFFMQGQPAHCNNRLQHASLNTENGLINRNANGKNTPKISKT